jgi:hypothetical protein
MILALLTIHLLLSFMFGALILAIVTKMNIATEC